MKPTTILTSLLLFVLTCVAPGAQAQTINTVIGTGTYGYSGDGGLATAANITEAWGLELDPATGNIYIADVYNNRIRKMAPSGVITTIAGTGTASFSGDGGPATLAAVHHPTAIAVFGTDIYYSESFSQRVRKINAAGIISTVAGNGISGYSGDGGPAINAKISEPDGITVDGLGNLYISDQYTNRIRKVTPAGIITTIAGCGVMGYSGDGGPATLATMNLPDGICTDAANNIVFSDIHNNVVRKINVTTGIISTIAGTGTGGFSGDGGPATAAKLWSPADVHYDAAGNLYICDATNNRIRKVTPDGTISTIAGTGIAGFSGDGGPPLSAQLYNVNLIRPDASGNLYVGDMYNHRIRKIVYANAVPVFTAGVSTTLTICENAGAVPINSSLAITDADVGQTETWSLWIAPLHGTALISYSATSTGATITPTGLTYTPATGYSGADSFKVRVFDGLGADTITVFVTINPLPDTGFILGASSMCIGTSVIFASTVAGGVWASSMPSVASVNSGGVVSGLSIGTTVISYTTTNACGNAVDTQSVVVGTSPSAFILGSATSLCAGTLAVYTGSPAGGMWGSSSSAIATVSGGIVGGADVGTAIITYTITNSCGTASDTQMITISPLPAATVSGPAALCLGTSATFTGAPSGGTWHTSSPAVATINSSGYVNSLGAGTTVISYTTSNSCGSATDTLPLIVVPLPDAGVITAPSVLCVGASMSINNSVSGGSWSIAPISVATINTSPDIITGLSAGTAILSYNIPPDDHGCTNVATFSVSLIPGLTVAGSINDIKCAGDTGSILLTVSGGVGPYQYTWYNGSTANVVNDLAPGSYTVAISDPASGCNTSDSFTIGNAVPILLSSVEVNDRCSGRHGEIDITVSGGASPYTYSWSNGAATEDITDLLAGGYSVTVRDANQCYKEFSIVVGEDSCGQIVIHNVITPNGDGINDAWIIDGLSTHPNTGVTVFDKWGDAVFKAGNYDNTWSGKGTNGDLIPDGTYFYLVKLAEKDNFTGKKDFTGSLLIKR